MNILFSLLLLFSIFDMHASSQSFSSASSGGSGGAAVPSAYKSSWRQEEFERDQQEFLTSGKRYEEYRRGTGTEGGGSYGHWFYKKLDGSVINSFNHNGAFSDERDAWLLQAYNHNESINRLANNGWSADHATLDDDSLLKKLEQDATAPALTTPQKRTVSIQRNSKGKESMKITVDNPPPLIDWLAKQLTRQSAEGALLQQLFVGFWRKRDKTVDATIQNAQTIQKMHRERGAYLDPQQVNKIAQETGCVCIKPGKCENTQWKVSRFENAMIYEDIINHRTLTLGVFPAWIQRHQGKFQISQDKLVDAQQTQGTLLGNLERTQQISPGGPSMAAGNQAANSSSKE